MKKIFTIVLAFMAIAFPLSAQDSNRNGNPDPKTPTETSKKSWADPLHLEFSFGVSTPSKGVVPWGSLIDLNYQVKRFSFHALVDAAYFLPKNGMTKDYNKTVNLGGGVGFELFPREENNRSVFEARASVTRSLGSADYRNTSYKVGIQWLAKPKKRLICPSIGFGYCLRSFSNKDIHTYNGMYLTLGIRF